MTVRHSVVSLRQQEMAALLRPVGRIKTLFARTSQPRRFLGHRCSTKYQWRQRFKRPPKTLFQASHPQVCPSEHFVTIGKCNQEMDFRVSYPKVWSTEYRLKWCKVGGGGWRWGELLCCCSTAGELENSNSLHIARLWQKKTQREQKAKERRKNQTSLIINQVCTQSSLYKSLFLYGC